MCPTNLFPLALGTARFGTDIPRTTAFSILDAYMNYGGNLLDTAAIYGMGVSEQTIGDWLNDRGARSKMTISTKGGHPSLPDWQCRITEADIRSDIEHSLGYLQTDYVDIYFLHRDDESQSVDVIMPILNKLVCEGKTRHIGASNWTVARINEANNFARKNGMAEFCMSQILWNGAIINKNGVKDQTLVVMDDIEHKGYSANRMPVMAYTSQAHGLFSLIRDKGFDGLSEDIIRTYLNTATRERAMRILAVSENTGVSPTAVSLAYLLHNKDVKAYPILGISRPERFFEAMGVFSLREREINSLFS